jgi:SAM-dependent methyltransferase
MYKDLSIIRAAEYEALRSVTMSGVVLDVGGSKNAGYHLLIGGSPTFKVINFNEKTQPDYMFDIEQPFPLASDTFDHAICLNVLEHVFEFDHAFKEQVRCVRSGGTIAIAVPFMHHIHGSPDDFLRYTESSLRRLADKYNCSVEQLIPLGNGFFSLAFQSLGAACKIGFMNRFLKRLAIATDVFLCRVSKKYKIVAASLPLGYFVVYRKR